MNAIIRILYESEIKLIMKINMNINIHICLTYKAYCEQKKFMKIEICMFYERLTQAWTVIETYSRHLCFVHT
jgi:L-fucose mutarotase/ribose pyranase (RbsD/FucU family)